MKYGLEEQTIFLIFGKYPEVEEVILYGSRAKGNFKPFSDIDITLKGKISPETLLSINCAFSESSLPYLFDISIFNDLNNQNLIDHINRWGKVIYTAASTDISASHNQSKSDYNTKGPSSKLHFNRLPTR